MKWNRKREIQFQSLWHKSFNDTIHFNTNLLFTHLLVHRSSSKLLIVLNLFRRLSKLDLFMKRTMMIIEYCSFNSRREIWRKKNTDPYTKEILWSIEEISQQKFNWRFFSLILFQIISNNFTNKKSRRRTRTKAKQCVDEGDEFWNRYWKHCVFNEFVSLQTEFGERREKMNRHWVHQISIDHLNEDNNIPKEMIE